MKKYLIPVMALIMILAAAITVRADWVQNGNDYYYYNGDTLVKNQIIDDEYYVDDTGKMVTNVWVKLQEDNEIKFLYFGATGKMAKDKWQTIGDKTYHFDENGYMEKGWIMENMYFCHLDDGHLLTGWQRLQDPDTDEHTAGPLEDSNIHWFYFSPNTGKKYCADNGQEFLERRIENKRYCFNQIGALQTGWVKVADGDGISGYKYYDPTGADVKDWMSLNPPDELSSYYPYEVMWFYFQSNGFPACDEDGIPTTSDIRRIGSNKTKRYYFNLWGTPVWGLTKMYTREDGSDWDTYFFGTFNQSCVQKGKFQIYDGNDAPDTFFFLESGAGYTGSHKENGAHYLYYKGKLQKAEKGTKYEVIEVNEASYLVNESGKVCTSSSNSKTYTDGDGVKWGVNSEGIVCTKDGVIFDGRGRDPEAPTFGG